MSVQEAPAPAREEQAVRPSRLRRWRGPIGASLIFVVIIAFWHLAVASGLVHEVILPPPADVGLALVSTFSEGFFYEHLWVTVQEILIGFVIGVIIGFAVGAILGTSALMREISLPYVVAFQGLPKIVLAPIFITAFGFGMTSKVVMAIVISFFPLLVNTMSGLMTVDAEAVRLMRSLTASRRDIFFKLSVMHAMPSIFAGIKTSLTLALVGAIVGEFVGARNGLGFLLASYSYQLQVDRVWAITLILAIIGIILYVTIEYIERKVVFWGTLQTGEAGM